jgi:hypothetical protein
MLLEFIIIHSSAFLGNAALGRARGRDALRAVLGRAGFYTLFVAGFALAFKTWSAARELLGAHVHLAAGADPGQAPNDEAKLAHRGAGRDGKRP